MELCECVDYRPLNQITAEDVYPMPRVEDMIEQLSSAMYITTLDLSKGYYQVALKQEDKVKTAFSSHVGSSV